MKEELNIQPRPEPRPKPRPKPDFKVETIERLKKLERRGVTVGTHLDELRSVVSSLVERMPD